MSSAPPAKPDAALPADGPAAPWPPAAVPRPSWPARLRELTRTLRFRLTLYNTALVLLVGGLTLVGIHRAVRATLLDQFEATLREDAQEVRLSAAAVRGDLERLSPLWERKAATHHQHGWFVQVCDGDGQALWSTEPGLDLAAVEPPDDEAGDGPTWADAPPFRLVQMVVRPPGQEQRILRVGASLASIDNAMRHLTRTLLLAGAALGVIAPLGGYWLAGRATRPLADIIDTTARLRPGRFDERLPRPHTGDELDRLARTINGMLDRIATHLHQSRDFVANAAHELRSPLTRMRTALDEALANPAGPDLSRLADVLEELGELETLVSRLLVLAESDAGCVSPRAEPVRLDELARQSLAMFGGVAEAGGLVLEAPRLDAALVPGDAQFLRHVVNNLLDNAVKFTPKGGRVRVEVRADRGRGLAALVVADTGRGLRPEELARVFERFYRADKTHGRDGPRGTGLGLSICRSIVTALHGDIEANSSPGVGSTFLVTLPLARPV